MNILVLSTYDVTPVSTGGQSRYVNIYRRIGAHHDIAILAYDVRRRTDRTYSLGERLRVVAPRFADADRDRLTALHALTGHSLDDVLCIRDYRFSPQFYAALRREAARAEVIVASHPYLAPLAFGYSPTRSVKIYEAHNVEYDAKRAYFADAADPVLARFLEEVWQGERLACVEADYVTAASDDDADRLAELYAVPRRKIATIPNGADTAAFPPVRAKDKATLRAHFAAGDRPIGVFMGGDHPPNLDAYLRTRALLAQAGYTGLVIVLGTIAERLPAVSAAARFEEVRLGFVDEAVKAVVLGSADFALQFSVTGAGTTLKLFDYMAARTLIVANRFGRRGIPFEDWCWPVETAAELRRFLAEQPWRKPEGRQIAQRARRIAEQHYDWGRIAASYERLIARGRGGDIASELAGRFAAH